MKLQFINRVLVQGQNRGPPTQNIIQTVATKSKCKVRDWQRLLEADSQIVGRQITPLSSES